MKRLINLFLVLGAILLFAVCSEDNLLTPGSDQIDQESSSLKSAKPAPKLIGTIFTNFTVTPPTFWNGTIDFGAEGIYGITFISYTAPRDYSQASPFEEDFIIYELGKDWTIPENVVMKGWNKGVLTFANKVPDPTKVRANGEIVEAYEPFEGWQDRNVHWSGYVIWVTVGLPESFQGTFRIN